jgi:phosphoribosylformylglycinamidine synthase
MMRLGIFFEEHATGSPATLTWNNQGRFESRWVHLKSGETKSPFLVDIDRMYLPMAHAEGRFVAKDNATLERLKLQQQVALRYCGEDGSSGDEVLPFPINPNGASLNLAGLCDESGRVFGLMPHPERHLFPTHHPFWTRLTEQPEHGDGLKLFQNAVAYFA